MLPVLSVVIVFTTGLQLVKGDSAAAADSPSSFQNLVSLGSINGKYFFYLNTLVTWLEAKKICTNAGLILAEVKTGSEFEFIKRKTFSKQFDGGYWVGGRDAQTHVQFVWDNSTERFSSSLPFNPNDLSPLTCLTLWVSQADGHTYSQFMPFPCDGDLAFHTLCQTI